ncbi:hypothetical protein NDU88_002093 [Pleurodeles waltl]|uniref:DinB-like domain-containing protein n=1 Tax=Pleurodeles waltl TaxID=8319 RepID=A0AAV7TKN6_PLEWA|nr:hypothetical protein NDU88_002093 [Pleurodeles waltl]
MWRLLARNIGQDFLELHDRAAITVGEIEKSLKEKGIIKDPQGSDKFSPDRIKHPRSAEWWLLTHVAEFLKLWIRRPLEKEARAVTRAECARPVVKNKACVTPDLDPDPISFLFKLGRDPREGLERALKQYQDKLLDVIGSLAKIMDMAEEAKSKDVPVDFDLLQGWSQRAVCFLWNANAALVAESHIDED